MNKRRLISVVLMMIAILVMSLNAQAGEGITTVRCGLRSTVGSDGIVIKSLNKGERVNIIEKVSDWYRVEYDGTEGYLHKSVIEESFEDGDSLIEDGMSGTPTIEGEWYGDLLGTEITLVINDDETYNLSVAVNNSTHNGKWVMEEDYIIFDKETEGEFRGKLDENGFIIVDFGTGTDISFTREHVKMYVPAEEIKGLKSDYIGKWESKYWETSDDDELAGVIIKADKSNGSFVTINIDANIIEIVNN